MSTVQEQTATPAIRRGFAPHSDAPNLVPEPRFERWLSIGLGLSFVLILLYVAFVRIGVRVDALGVLLSEGASAQLGVARNGTVREVLARDQDMVASGETLLVIDHPRPGAQEMEERLGMRRKQVTAKLEQLHAGSKAAAGAATAELEDQYEMALMDIDNRLQSLRGGARTYVTAPRSGRVIDLRLREGESVRQGQILGSIVDDAPRFHAIAYLPASSANRVNVGSTATISLEQDSWSRAATITGKIVRISRLPVTPEAIDPQLLPRVPLVAVDIEIGEHAIPDAQLPRLTPGMTAPIKLHGQEQTIAAWLLARYR
ncbi:HlyD family efflux transporter periplasmic adaptor subunit [Lysobacter tyrosinilyticus]